MHTRFPARGLYAITNGPRPDLLLACEAALRGGAAILQYRDKTSDHARRRKEAVELSMLCDSLGVPFIVNDDIELAAEVRAFGVHLGKDDADLAAARAQLGKRACIGVSCYDSLDRARAAVDARADYLAFGAFYPSATKPHNRRAAPELLRAARALGKPLVAIGGITPDNASPLIDAGADLVAAISGVFASADIESAARRYAQLFQA